MIPFDLLADIALTRIDNPTAKLILLELAVHSNGKGECFPSQARLALGTCLAERTVRDAIRWLEANGYLKTIQRQNTSNLYLLTVMQEDAMEDPPAKSAAEVDSNIAKLDFSKRGKTMTTYPAKSAATLDTPFFLSFWQAYPRRIGKGEARVAFARAARIADPNTIVRAAMTYATHCEEMNIEPQFRPHPATWLNQERWEDDLEGEKATKTSGWGGILNEL